MSIEIGGVEVFSLEEVSQRLGVEADALKRLMRRGELVARKIGDHWFITSQNLLAFLQTPAAPSKRSMKHARPAEEHPAIPLPPPVASLEPTPLIGPAAPAAEAIPADEAPAPTPPALEEEIISAAPAAALREADSEIAKPETVFPHQLVPPVPEQAITAQKATEPILTSIKVMPPSATEPLFVSASESPALPPPVPGISESEKATDLNVPSVPLPAHLTPPPRAESPTSPTLIVGTVADPPKPASGSSDAMAALFDLPFISPDEPIMNGLHAPTPPCGPSFGNAEDKHALAIEATRRRATAKTGVADDPPAPGAAPGDSQARRTLLDSEEMPSVSVDQPGASHAPETRPVVKVMAPPRLASPGARLSDIPDMFGPDSPTVLLTPEQVASDAERTKKLLAEFMEQGRIAQRARDEVVATVRKLPLEEQSFALAGPIGEQLVKLDKLIEDGVRAQKELGLSTPPAAPDVVNAAHRTPAALPKMEESKWLPLAKQAVADPMPLIAPQSDSSIPIAPLHTPPSKRPSSRVGQVGGETWQEVGLPAPLASAGARPDSPVIVRLTLSLSDEEKRVLSDHRIAEEVAVQEIMRRYQPTDERGWVDAKGRYFQPLRGKGEVRA
ncbi:MAG: hypothetical protein FD180_1836 [Planctomycetota bacterium]|nr:MAG: hypothetical protein FD180_1836 [Planctomycetota bacterium]